MLTRLIHATVYSSTVFAAMYKWHVQGLIRPLKKDQVHLIHATVYSFDSVCGIVHVASTESRWLHYSLETIEREIERERKKDRERERERERKR